MSAETENEQINPETESAEQEEIPANLNDAGKAALKAERDARKVAAKEARELKEQLTALQTKQAEADEAKRLADEAEAVRKGEFETLATSRAEEVKAVTGERDGYKTQLDSLIAAIRPDVDASWKDVPDEIKSFYDGADDDVLAKRAFLAKSKPAIDKLAAQQNEQNDRFRKVPTTPKPNGKGGDDDEARKAQASMYRSF